jgi:alpha-beta hydrolase superfamily lysophospholipase
MSHAGTLGTLVFSHGNGFPANTYRQLFSQWEAAGWRVRALPRFGHDPRYPVTSSWPHLREELLAFIAREAPPEEPLVLVGLNRPGF